MTQTNYEKGKSAEYYVRERLRKAGWRVLRTAASRTPIDLLASKSSGLGLTKVVAVQVRVSKKQISFTGRERIEFEDWALGFGASPILASRVGRKWSFTQTFSAKPWSLEEGETVG